MQYNQCQGQTRKLLPIDFSGASETSLKVYVYKQKSINSGKNNNRTEYWYVVEGVPRNTYQIEWTR